MILSTLLLTSASLRIGVLGEGRLRFEVGHAAAFASSASLTVNRKGLLVDEAGHPVLPHVHVAGSRFAVSMNGTVSVAGHVAGRLVLHRSNGTIGFPGEGTFGVIEIKQTTPTPLIGTDVVMGSLVRTEDPLNIAIQGNGFFKVTCEDGQPAFMRIGTFHLDDSGNIVNPDGLPLDPAVKIPPQTACLTVQPDGEVRGILPGMRRDTALGRVQLSLFVNPGGLRRIGPNLFVDSTASGECADVVPGTNNAGVLLGGYLESGKPILASERLNALEKLTR